METQKTLGLKTPERTSSSSTSFLASPKDVESWIKSLPTANVGETSRQVFKTLVEFNRVDIPNIARIKNAEIFRQPIDYIASNLRKYYYDVSFPLSAKNRKIAVLNRELYAELAIAYKIFIEMMVSGKGGKFDKKLLVIAIHRTLRYLGLVHYQSAIVYDPNPANIWKEVNRLYAFAEQNKIDHIPVTEGKDKSQTSTISDVYKQILLFSITSPYRQRQREILHIHQMLPSWAKKISLEKRSSGTHASSEFVIKISEDNPPLHLELLDEKLSEQDRIITTHELVTFLRSEFDALPTEQPGLESYSSRNRTSKHLLRQLIQILSSAPKREFVRTKLNFELKTAVGLSAIHALLSLKPKATQPADEDQDEEMDWYDQHQSGQSLYTSEQQRRLSISPNTPAHEETILSGYHQPGSYKYTQAAAWTNPADEAAIETFVCKTVNESAGGYCIHWHGVNTPRIRVGEIIGIQSATNSNQFGIGISRWMKNTPGFGLQIGMEMISPGSIPVSIKSTEHADAPDSVHKGLLLPELKSSGKAASLVVATMLFKTGDKLVLETENGHSHIRLTRMLESTGAFTQFQFIHQSTKNSLSGTSDEKTDEDFDNIWSML